MAHATINHLCGYYHEVCSALSVPQGTARPAAQSRYRALRPMGWWGRPSCDGTPLEFRIIDLITQHDVGADEQLPTHCHFGFWTPAVPPGADKTVSGQHPYGAPCG